MPLARCVEVLLYSMYTGNPLLHWPSTMIFSDIRVCSASLLYLWYALKMYLTSADRPYQANCFPRVIQYAKSGLKPMVGASHQFDLDNAHPATVTP